ncbi:winged helix-turn-helix domain-containing protein [Candidatus Acetothermia bacterium]|nr:winged helix-turn-helix domain-containing protein [Candidatus Acetothermia bacterium]
MKNPSLIRERLGLKTIHPPQPVLPRVTASSNGRESEIKASLYVCLLGDFQVWRDGVLITPEEWKTQKEKTLMKILLTERGHLVQQDQLIEALWPNLCPQLAHNSLWVCVNHLRHTLEPQLSKPADSHFILWRSNGYLFSAEDICTLDTDELTIYLKRGDDFKQKEELDSAIAAYQAAEALYRGDYLEEDPYEDWAVIRRSELLQSYGEILKNLAECWAQAGQHQKALTCYQKILAKERCHEAIWHQVMLCYWRLGERDRALLAFEQCCEILKRELRIQPMPQTLELRQFITKTTFQSKELAKI